MFDHNIEIPETNHYLEFVKRHFPGKYMVNWHHALASFYLCKWVNGEIPYLIMEWPPQYGKSEIGAVMLAAYVFSCFPTSKFAYATYGDTLAKRMSKNSKKILRRDDYKLDFDELTVPLGFRGWELWENSLGGIYTGVSRDGGLAGTPQDFLVCDDLFKNYKEAMSPVIRESVWFWFTTVALERLSPNGRALLFFTRWHDDDVIGRCLKLTEKSSHARPWVRISFAGLMTEEKFQTKHPADPREIGEPLWPWKDDEEDLEMKRLEMGEAAFNAVIQQTSINAKGDKIKIDWLKKINRADVPKNLKWFRFYRFGELEKNSADRENGTCLMAKTPNGEYVVSELESFQDDWPSSLERLTDIGESEKRVKVGFKKVGGKNKSELIEQVMKCKRKVRSLRGFEPVDPLIWTPKAKAKKVLFVEDETTANFVESCRHYTGSGRDKNEAGIHALAGAYHMIASKRSIVQIMAEKNKKLQARKRR